MNKEPLKTVYKAVSDRYRRFVRFRTEHPNTAFPLKMWEREVKKRIAREQESADWHGWGPDIPD
ncbi:MAG: hypothetical protein BWK80_47820 [Desulfobacteraceae bacterium IS3]|nr:MAG: hypothetical protein BWK80_47820 [Desulfobacteraceae bacterium IS3]